MLSSKKVKVLFRLRSMEVGGVQKVLLNVLKNLDRDKFEISLLLNIYQGRCLSEIPSDVTVYHLGKGKEQMSGITYIKYLQLILRRLKLYFFDFFPNAINRLILKKPFDVDVAFIDNLVHCLVRTTEPNTKKIGWIHGDLTKANYSQQKKESIVRDFLSLHQMVYVSYDTLRSTQTIIDYADKNAVVIHNPIDVGHIVQQSKESISEPISSILTDGIFSFIFVGRVYEGKGCKMLYKAHKSLLRQNINHKVYLVGAGEELELKKLAEEENNSQSFIVLGEKANPYPYINAADSFVLPSSSEGYPLVIAEALVLGKPVLCTQVGGIAEMVENKKNGLFIEYNQESLEQGMKKFITDQELFSRIKTNNKECIHLFNPQEVYGKIEELLST